MHGIHCNSVVKAFVYSQGNYKVWDGWSEVLWILRALCVCITKDGWSQLRLNFKGRRRLGLSIWVEEGRWCPDFHGPGWDSPSEDKQIVPWVHLLEEALPGTCLRFPMNGNQPSLQESTRCRLNLWPLTPMREPGVPGLSVKREATGTTAWWNQRVKPENGVKRRQHQGSTPWLFWDGVCWISAQGGTLKFP